MVELLAALPEQRRTGAVLETLAPMAHRGQQIVAGAAVALAQRVPPHLAATAVLVLSLFELGLTNEQ